MKLKGLIWIAAVIAFGASSVVPFPLSSYELHAKLRKEERKKRTRTRNRSIANAGQSPQTRARNAANENRRRERAQLNVPVQDLMARQAGDRRNFRDISSTRAVYPQSNAANAGPSGNRTTRRGATTRLEISSVSANSTASSVLPRRPMPER